MFAIGFVHKWRHAVFDNFRPTRPPPFSHESRFLVLRILYCPHKILDPCPKGREVIYGRPLNDYLSLSNKVFLKLLTGDALLIRGCGRTYFQEGDAGGSDFDRTLFILNFPTSTVLTMGPFICPFLTPPPPMWHFTFETRCFLETYNMIWTVKWIEKKVSFKA